MKRWLYDFLDEKVIIHAKMSEPCYSLILAHRIFCYLHRSSSIAVIETMSNGESSP
jgi:hypothetical protein